MTTRKKTVHRCPLCDDDMVMQVNHDYEVAWICSGCRARLSLQKEAQR